MARIRFIILIVFILSGCNLATEPRVVYVTGTPETPLPDETVIMETSPPQAVASPMPTDGANSPVMIPTAPINPNAPHHVVQPGDMLSTIALTYNTTLATLIELNGITNADMIEVGQVLILPPPPQNVTPNQPLLGNSQFVRGAYSEGFDIADFVARQPGFIRMATDTVPTNNADGRAMEALLTAVQVVQRVSLEYSVDARVLLAILEYRAGWLSNPTPINETHPIISQEASGMIDRSGLYRQLSWVANELNRGYYGWKYNSNWRVLDLADGERFLYQSGLNAATIALQYFFSLHNSISYWQHDVSLQGFYRVYQQYFGDPLAYANDPLLGMPIMPALGLPFSRGEVWFFTGGAHGGWGSGSAWSAIDFAPPDDRRDVFCYTSDYYATAVTAGVIARSDSGAVVLDLDGDGLETTGWNIHYLHIAAQDRVPVGAYVNAGDRIGRPSCEGGFSTATHMHIGRRYNGEWVPAYCDTCAHMANFTNFTLDGWQVIALRNQEYQGYLEKNGERRIAEQGRAAVVNRVSW